MKKLTEEVVKGELIKWFKNPTDVNTDGICFTIEEHLYHIFKEDVFLFDFSKAWLKDNYKEFSGSRGFPIPSPIADVAPADYFDKYKGEWNEEYKNSRMNLLKVMQDSLDFVAFSDEGLVKIEFGANYENEKSNNDWELLYKTAK